MTVNTKKITSGPYAGNGIADTFSYGFKVTDKTELSVFETDDAGNQTELIVDTDYVVNSVGDDDGGTITRTSGPLPTGYQWYIRSAYDETQLTAFTSQGAFFPDLHEEAMDKLTFLIQQISDLLGRSPRLSISYSGDLPLSLEDPVAGFALRWNGGANGLENYDPSTVSNDEIGADKPVINYPTLAVAIADPDLKLNQACNVKERVLDAGSSSGGFWDVVALSSVVPNDFDIVACTGAPDLALVLRIKNTTNIKSFGAIGDGVSDNEDLLQKTIAIDEVKTILPDGVFLTTEPVAIDSVNLASGRQVIEGSRKRLTKIISNVNNALPIRDNVHLKNFTLQGDISSNWGNDIGPAIRTTDTGLSAYAQIKNTEVNGYKVGAFIRNSVNTAYRDLNWRSNACHIMLARHPYVNSGNPISPGGWNQADGQGFFQNIVSIRDSNFSFGEVGIMGVSLCGVYDAVSTQAQHTNPSGNDFIGAGEKGTGIWLQGGAGFGSRRGSGANSIRGWYSEASDRGLYLKDQDYCEVKASFMQGGSSSDPSEFALIDNSIVHMQGCIKYDWFSPMIIQNGSLVFHSDATQGAGGSVQTDQSSKYHPRGEVDRHRFDYFVSTAGSSGDTFVLSEQLPDNSFGEVKITLLYNGTTTETYIADVTRWSNGPVVVTWRGADPSSNRFTLTDAGSGAIRLSSVAFSPWQGNILLTVQGGPDISGNQITLNAE